MAIYRAGADSGAFLIYGADIFPNIPKISIHELWRECCEIANKFCCLLQTAFYRDLSRGLANYSKLKSLMICCLINI